MFGALPKTKNPGHPMGHTGIYSARRWAFSLGALQRHDQLQNELVAFKAVLGLGLVIPLGGKMNP